MYVVFGVLGDVVGNDYIDVLNVDAPRSYIRCHQYLDFSCFEPLHDFQALFLVHGALWLANKSEGELHERAVKMAKRLWVVLLCIAAVFLYASFFATKLYDNYLARPSLFIFVLITLAALLGTRYYLAKKSTWKAWFSSAVTIIGATFFGVIGL